MSVGVGRAIGAATAPALIAGVLITTAISVGTTVAQDVWCPKKE